MSENVILASHRATFEGMKSNLVQKTITDKNGVTSKRWVKPEHGVSATGSLPAPRTESKEERELTKYKVKLRTLFGHLSHNDFDVDGIVEAMYGYEVETLKIILKDIESDPETRLDLAAQWVELYRENERYLRELFAYCDAFDPSTDYSFVEDAVSQVRTYEGLPSMDDYSVAPPELQQTLRNLLNVTETLLSESYEDRPREVVPILPESLYRLVVERPQDLDRINEIILDTPGVCDGEQIAMMLDSDTPRLAEGIL